jgi:hypothetical protein
MTSPSSAPSLSVENQKLHEENKGLRATLLRSETELKLMIEAVTRLQEESTLTLELARILKKRVEELEYAARDLVNCDGFTGLTTSPDEVIRHLKSHIEDLAEVLREK